MLLQIHIGGPKRAGKTTLARGIETYMRSWGTRAVVLDVDEVRVEIFGSMRGAPDSVESRQDHNLTMSVIYNCIIQRMVGAGVTPIVVAGHSTRYWFERAMALGERLGTEPLFFLVESPTLDQIMTRAMYAKADDRTDMRDLSDPIAQQSFTDAVKRIEQEYSNITDARLHRIPQGAPEEMASTAFSVVLGI